MAKVQISSIQKTQPDVAGALEEIRSKKSREQVKAERFQPFIPVIDEALKCGWKWSPILRLIRERSGPSLTKKEAGELYAAHGAPSMSGHIAAHSSGASENTQKPTMEQEATE